MDYIDHDDAYVQEKKKPVIMSEENKKLCRILFSMQTM